jgi:HSP20 family protein
MREQFKRLGESVERGAEHAWQQLSEGWHELISRARGAVTRYTRGHDEVQDAATEWLRFTPAWGLVAGEIEQDDGNVYVRIELPGLDRQDIELEVHDGVLAVRGEKRFARESAQGSFTLLERSYGRFERVFELPCSVDADKAAAKYRDGVLAVTLPKLKRGSRLAVS